MFHIASMKAFSPSTLFYPSCFPQKSILFSKLPKPISKHLIFLCPTVSMSSSRASMPLNPKPSNKAGEIHVIVGPMFAGKTTTLLRRMNAESVNGSFQGKKKCPGLDQTLKELCFSGRVVEAIGLLCCTGLRVETETYALLVQECIFRKEYKNGKRVHWQMVIVGYVPGEYLQIKLLIFYAKGGELKTAHILFDKLVEKTLVSWNSIIAGYVQNGLEEVGLHLYHRMRICGLMPDQYTFSSIFRACASLAILEQGKQAHAILIKSQISRNVVVNSALIDMYFKCSNPSEGLLVFNNSLEKNVITWTALVAGYGQHGKVTEVLESFHKMIDEGFKPNQVTFLAVLSACSHRGLINEGWKYFSSMMKDYGIQPREKHYAAMVDLLGRSGRLDEAYEFVKNCPYKEHPVVWGSLLGACRIYGNVDLIKLAAQNFFELETENTGKYIVLCNAYASFGLWGNVAEIRKGMKELGLAKDPGYSMIEIQKAVHMFFMGHNTHKQTGVIYEVILDLTSVLKDAGDVPDL